MRGKLAELEARLQRVPKRRERNPRQHAEAWSTRETRDAAICSTTARRWLAAAERLSEGYEEQLAARRVNFVALGVVLCCRLLLLLIGKVTPDDSANAPKQSEGRTAAIRTPSCGCSTRSATSPTVTHGARQGDRGHDGRHTTPSNFTIDELRRLVAGINDAAQQGDPATEEAQDGPGSCCRRNRAPGKRNRAGRQSVTHMAQSMKEVSLNRGEADTAKVAETSLSAAEKGALRADNSIRG